MSKLIPNNLKNKILADPIVNDFIKKDIAELASARKIDPVEGVVSKNKKTAMHLGGTISVDFFRYITTAYPELMELQDKKSLLSRRLIELFPHIKSKEI